MNLDIKQSKGSLLVVPQFTLLGDLRKGKRPSFIKAEKPEIADKKIKKLINIIKNSDIPTFSGEFQANMEVTLINDGPVTILIDSRKTF